MDSDAFEGLETRISKVMKLVQQLKQENEGLRAELQLSRERIREQDGLHQEWERERNTMRGRIDKVMAELDKIEKAAE